MPENMESYPGRGPLISRPIDGVEVFRHTATSVGALSEGRVMATIPERLMGHTFSAGTLGLMNNFGATRGSVEVRRRNLGQVPSSRLSASVVGSGPLAGSTLEDLGLQVADHSPEVGKGDGSLSGQVSERLLALTEGPGESAALSNHGFGNSNGVFLLFGEDGIGLKTKVKFRSDSDKTGGTQPPDFGKFIHPHPPKSLFEVDPSLSDPTPAPKDEDKPPIGFPPVRGLLKSIFDLLAERDKFTWFPGKFTGGSDVGWHPFEPLKPEFPALRPKSGALGPWPIGGGVSGGLWGGGILSDPPPGLAGGVFIQLGKGIRLWVGASTTTPDEQGHMQPGGEVGIAILWD